jgi:predicted transposase/invertase (TIGR01784 family)
MKMKGNKNYKDTVFRSLFNNEPAALELYNALEGTNCTDVSIIKINTLKDLLFKTIENDLSFEVNKKMLILIEHQSTISENMAARFLLYIAVIYFKKFGEKLYQEQVVKLPRPEFIVLYNGEAPFPDEKIYRLYDVLEEIDKEIDNNDLIPLDLTLRVININKGRNLKLMRKSKALKSYSAFVAKVRKYRKTKPLEEAIKLPIDDCLREGILADFLKENAQEVVEMIKLEYTLKDAIKFARKEGKEEGMEKGIKKGLDYVLELMAQGLSNEEIKKKIKKAKTSTKL